jgi:hypothetical protein
MVLKASVDCYEWTKRASQILEYMLADVAAGDSSAANKLLLSTLQPISNLKEYPSLWRAGTGSLNSFQLVNW